MKGSRERHVQPANCVLMGFAIGSKAGTRVIAAPEEDAEGLLDGGAKIALGTDSPQVFSVPGFSMHREMRQYLRSASTFHDPAIRHP